MKLNRLWCLVILVNSWMGIQAQSVPFLKLSRIKCGADRTEAYFSVLRGKNIGLVSNPTSRVGSVHLVDTLVHSGMKVMKIFAPEHGFRGEGEAGATINNGLDPVTGIPVISLYGKHKKPTPADLGRLDLVVFDIQDVGVRFYTYISTLHFVMEACAAEGKPLLLLDRPNPNGFYIDGPILDTAFRSFVGMHPVPVVYGLTIGEYAKMINGEGWLQNGLKCNLTVIVCEGYDHGTQYILPVKPSPNLPNQVSVYLYPSLCFFEGSVISIGRGTEFPFQVFGHPDLTGKFSFTPESKEGISLHPLYEKRLCYGSDLRQEGMKTFTEKQGIILDWVVDAWSALGKRNDFFTDYFDTLAGTSQLRLQIQQGLSPGQIRLGWEPGLRKYQKMREKYFLYD